MMFIRISLLFIIGCSALSAQEPRPIQVRSLCFKYSQKVKGVTLAGDAEGKVQTKMRLLEYLRPKQKKLTVTGSEILIGKAGGEGGFEAWEKVTLPPKTSNVLLVFFPSKREGKPYRVKAYDDSLRAFPEESFQISNMSSSPMRFIIGGTPVEIGPGKSKLVSKFKEKKANGQVPYYAYYKNGEDWARLSTGFWDVIPAKRSFQIAFGDTENKRISMKGYDDGLPRVLKAAQN